MKPQRHEQRPDLLHFHAKPTSDPHRAALPAPHCSPARAKWPDGIFGLRPQLGLQLNEVRPECYVLEGLFRICIYKGDEDPKEHLCSRRLPFGVPAFRAVLEEIHEASCSLAMKIPPLAAL